MIRDAAEGLVLSLDITRSNARWSLGRERDARPLSRPTLSSSCPYTVAVCVCVCVCVCECVCVSVCVCVCVCVCGC